MNTLIDVQQAIAAACTRVGRDPASVQLLAVSKAQPMDAVIALHTQGQRAFGENRAQELRDKAAALAHLEPAVEWHYIGPLQRNEIKYVVGTAAIFHALDSLKLAGEIDARVQSTGSAPLPVLVEVNLGEEGSKAGVPVNQVLELCRAVVALPGLALRGLMSIPPWDPDPEAMRPWHQRLAALAAEGRAQGLPLHELSMGMSNDFVVAVEEGATIVRVGTALFGPRGG